MTLRCHSGADRLSGRHGHRISNQIELLFLTVMVRVLLSLFSLDRALSLLDRTVLRRNRAESSFNIPDDRQLRWAGACLGRSLVRSQYLRNRGIPHRIVIGTSGGIGMFRAHAWIAPYEVEPEGFNELRAIRR